RYLEAGRLIQEALSRYVAEVREGVFPGEEHSF
ncbi:MAG: 3-methyl-2-oxobutanoate hydroxymethyltransferase, partial [Thermus sp.]|nr:3-methyl-2-oxobutanoate hydroxymethyltransferase [Thermus sp.]